MWLLLGERVTKGFRVTLPVLLNELCTRSLAVAGERSSLMRLKRESPHKAQSEFFRYVGSMLC